MWCVPPEASGRLQAASCDASSASAAGLTRLRVWHTCNGQLGSAIFLRQLPVLHACTLVITGSSSALDCQRALRMPAATVPNGTGITSNCAGVSTDSSCTAICSKGYSYANCSEPQNFTRRSLGGFSGTNPSCVATACDAMMLSAQYQTASCIGKVTIESCLIDFRGGWSQWQPCFFRMPGVRSMCTIRWSFLLPA